MKRVYIAGPITNDPKYLEHFEEAEDKLTELGLLPANPAKHDDRKEYSYKQYIDRGLQILAACDYICMLPGWDAKGAGNNPRSPGARLEYTYAKTVGMPLLLANRGLDGKLRIEIPRCWPGMFASDETKQP